MSDKTDQELIAAARAETNTCVCGDCLTRVTHRGYLLADRLERAEAEIARLRAALPSPELLRGIAQSVRLAGLAESAKSLLAAAARIEEVLK